MIDTGYKSSSFSNRSVFETQEVKEKKKGGKEGKKGLEEGRIGGRRQGQRTVRRREGGKW